MNTTPRIATVGVFDGLHRGHRALLDSLRFEGERRGLTPCVFTFDRHPLALISPDRAPSPLMTLEDKVKALSAYGIGDVEVLHFDDNLRSLTAAEFMTRLRDRYNVAVLMMGFNHHFGCDRISDPEEYTTLGHSLGIEIIHARELSDADSSISSSAVRKAIADGDIDSANRMLGHPFCISGRVISGKQIGRTIGYPTANLQRHDHSLLLPPKGVYAVDVILPDGQRRRGMLNIGVRPTVDSSSAPAPSIEAHVINWSGDLYGKEITLELLSRLRDEQRFDSLDALRRQLSEDRTRALEIKSQTII